MAEIIRQPKQQRSIDKKNRIIASGYELFAEKGYFNTNTAEIAKRAGVSTGIVYGYFHDKRDILIDVLDIYIEMVSTKLYSVFEERAKDNDLSKLVEGMLDATVEVHKSNAAIHEALHSLTASDAQVSEKFLVLENEMTKRFVGYMKELGYDASDVFERVHVSMTLVQSFSHEEVYDAHSYIDYDKMRKIVIDLIVALFSDK